MSVKRLRKKDVPPCPKDAPRIESGKTKIVDIDSYRWRFDSKGLARFIEYGPPLSDGRRLFVAMWERRGYKDG